MPDALPPDMDLNHLAPLPKGRSLGIGCIGAGFIMADCHLVAYRAAGFNSVAIASRNRASAEAAAGRHDIHAVFDNYRLLMQDPRVEVLDIAVPPDVLMDVI